MRTVCGHLGPGVDCSLIWSARRRGPELPAALQRRAGHGLAGDPPSSRDRRAAPRSAALGPGPVLVEGIKIGYKTINARGETLATTPAFRDVFKKRRCLVIADAFYEWQKLEGGKKQPYAISMKGTGLFAFAGPWEGWKDPTGQWLRTFTIVTTTPNELVAPIHDRMPAILPPEHYAQWLDEPNPQDLIARFPAHAMMAWQVSARIGDPKNDDPAVLDAAT